MGKPYSQDLRERVVGAVDAGTRVRVAAPLFRVSVSYIYKALIRRRRTGETTARPLGGGPEPKLAPHFDALCARVAAVPDATLGELQAWLSAERGVRVSIGCLWTTLRRLELTLKKSRTTPPSRTGRTSPRRARRGAIVKAS